jgi:hypothetical protein
VKAVILVSCLFCQVEQDTDQYSEWLQSSGLLSDTPAVDLDKPLVEVIPTLTMSTSQQELLNLTLRYNNKLSPNNILMTSAQAVADYHANTGRWGHSSRSFRPGASENIAWNGQRSINKISNQWQSSRSHNSNWLSNWEYVGVGVAFTDSKVYAVQHFSNKPAYSGTAVSLQSRRYNTSKRRWRLFRRR